MRGDKAPKNPKPEGLECFNGSHIQPLRGWVICHRFLPRISYGAIQGLTTSWLFVFFLILPGGIFWIIKSNAGRFVHSYRLTTILCTTDNLLSRYRLIKYTPLCRLLTSNMAGLLTGELIITLSPKISTTSILPYGLSGADQTI